MTIYSIVDSLTELDNIQRVQFLMDGKKKKLIISVISISEVCSDVTEV